jgi:hypothetical protein
LGLTSHNARLYLLEGSVPSAVFALGCLFSLRLRQPLIYRLAVEILGPDTPKGRDVTAAWRYPGFRRAFRVITMAWGVAYLVEAAVRSVIVATEPTGIALICSKLLPYAFAISLTAWTLVYGEREKKKAEHLADAHAAAAGSSAIPAGSSAIHAGSSAIPAGSSAPDVSTSASTGASPASPGH